MPRPISFLLPAALVVLNLTAASAQTPPARIGDTSKGKALVDSAGMTLYTYDRDTTGTSNCNGVCVTTWPPLQAPADAKADIKGDAKSSGDWSIVARSDGSKQWAYKGKPLYTFYKDGNPGDAAGDGVNNVWHIAAP